MIFSGVIVLYPGVFGEGGLIHIITGIIFIIVAAIDIWSIFVIFSKGKSVIKEYEKDKSNAVVIKD